MENIKVYFLCSAGTSCLVILISILYLLTSEIIFSPLNSVTSILYHAEYLD